MKYDPDLEAVVLLSEKIVFGPIGGRSYCRRITIDLRGEEILDS